MVSVCVERINNNLSVWLPVIITFFLPIYSSTISLVVSVTVYHQNGPGSIPCEGENFSQSNH